MTKRKEKKPYMAWWALPFLYQEVNGTRPPKVLMIGFHKPSDLGIPAKPDVVLIKEKNIIEAFPFPGSDLTKLVAGIILCSGEANLSRSASLLSTMVSVRRDTYREFNYHNMLSTDAVALAAEYGESWEVKEETSHLDVLMLKGAYSHFVKKGHKVNVQMIIAVGKDIRYNVPVLIFKKSWHNFMDTVRLWDGGTRFVAGLMFLVRYPPKGDRFTFLSEYELSAGIQKWARKLSDQSFVHLDPGKAVGELVAEVQLD